MRLQSRRRLKWLCYLLLMLLCYLLQTTPRLLTFGQVKPIWLIAVCCVIAVFEQPLPAGVCGMCCGLLYDLAWGSFFGLNGGLFLLIGAGVSLFVTYLLRQRLTVALLVTACGTLPVLLAGYLFYDVMWGYTGGRFWLLLIPNLLLTAFAALPLYPIVRLLAVRWFPER